MKTKPANFVWLLISAVLIFFVGGRWNFPLAAWLAPIFMIRFYRDSQKPVRDFLLLWLASAVPTILSWQGATGMLFGGPFAEPIFFLLAAPLGLIPYVLDRAYHRRYGAAFWVTLVFPLAASAMDFFSSGGSPYGSFGAAAYSQRGFLPVMQLASLMGLWGIAFLISWLAPVVNLIWESGFRRSVLIFAAVLALVFGYGLVRTLPAAQPAHTAQIAGFSLPNGKLRELIGQSQTANAADFRKAVDGLHRQLLDEIRHQAQQDADIVVLQEGAGLGHADQVEALLTRAAAIAKEEQVYLVLPTFAIDQQPPENVVHIIDPQGQVVLKHIKFGGNQFEGSLKGDGVLQAVDTPYGKLSAVICWDADFPDVIRQAGQQGIDLLFIPSNDWYEVRDIHAGMAAFRAVENGMAIYRQTGQGVSLVTDAYGREVSRVDSYADASEGIFAAAQMVDTPVGSTRTLYPQIGDVFGVIMLIGSAGLVLALAFMGLKKRIRKQ